MLEALGQGGKMYLVHRRKIRLVHSHVRPTFPTHVVHIKQAQLGLVGTYYMKPTNRETSSHPRPGSRSNWASGACERDWVVWHPMLRAFHCPKPQTALHFSIRNFPVSRLSRLASCSATSLTVVTLGSATYRPITIAIVQIRSFNSDPADFNCAFILFSGFAVRSY